MREIKFRAWDDEDEVIITWGDLEFERDKGEGIVIWKQVDETTKEIRELDLMQWTGLKDSKGVEIYEGDIIYYDVQNDSYEVAFNGGAFVWEGDGCYDILIELYPSLNTKVIGNIYENPELLEGN